MDYGGSKQRVASGTKYVFYHSVTIDLPINQPKIYIVILSKYRKIGWILT